MTWINKSEDAKGHIGSMNALMEAVDDFDYLISIEDDFLFIQDGTFISTALDIMDADPSIGLVLFNKDYRESDTENEARKLTATEDARVTPRGTQYLMQTHIAFQGTLEWDEYVNKTLPPSMVSNFHWGHFSFRPGVWRLSAMRAVGEFDSSLKGYGKPESDFARRYTAAGFKTAFLPGIHCIHLAVSSEIRKGLFGSVEDFDRMFLRHGLKGVTVASVQSTVAMQQMQPMDW